MTRSHDLLSRRRMAFRLSIAFALLAPFALRAGEAESLKARFATEAPLAWKEYQVYAERLQGVIETVGPVEGKEQERHRFECKSNMNCYVGITQQLLPKPRGWVHAYNSSYGFTLHRNTSDGPWILDKLKMGPKDEEFWKPGATTLRSTCIRISIGDLDEVVRLPKFRVVGANKVSRGKAELCQIDYETHGGEGKGTLLLDPNRFWILHAYTIHSKDSGGSVINRAEIEFRDPLAKYPIPKRLIAASEVTPLKGSKFHAESVREFDLNEVSRLPSDEEFTLSAFGLPEPGRSAPKRTPWYLWLAGAAALCALIAFGFRYLRRRRAALARV